MTEISFRRSAEIQSSVMLGLLVREYNFKIGDSRIGWFWILTEPVVQVAALSALWYVARVQTILSVPVALFITTGLIPFAFFRESISFVPRIVSQSTHLFDFRQVKPFDAMLARFVLSTLLTLLAAALFLLSLWWFFDYEIAPAQPAELIGAIALLAMGGFGLSLLLGVFGTLYDSVRRGSEYATRPLFFLSGIFYAYQQLPIQAQDILKWNPAMQYITLIRCYMFGHDIPRGISPEIMSFVSLASLATGMVVYYAYRVRLIQK